MNNLMNRSLRRYFRSIQRKLPYVSGVKHQYLSFVRRSVDEFLSENPDCDIELVYQEIGTVSELCEAYKNSLTDEQIALIARRTRKLYGSVGVLSFLFVIVSIILTYHTFKTAPKEIHIDTYIFYETEVENMEDVP